jgi:hypothetical protein
MEKFLSIPVTDEQNQLVSANNVILVEQASATTVTITYAGGKVVTLTHATAGAVTVETERDAIQAAIVAALQSPWYSVSYQVNNLPFAVTGIAVA